ncbi:restriction endonuclease fold toxin-2 domain-containing protein [Streptomyces sp. NPDC020422]|uniref:restriction endonuclease fold toxin-2 domain-containing protein n=1 Tax=Streptomyces sp. NPDC020422 TaxID=3365074 RepID=UPI00379095A5
MEAAKGTFAERKLDLFAVEMPWDQPVFGGNGYDGGLLDAVLGGSWIRDLGSLGHALDSSAARIKLPAVDPPTAPAIPGLPFLPPLIPAPVPVPAPVVLASYTGQVPALAPVINPVDPGISFADPIPPVPGTTRLLTAPEQQHFRAWVNTLRPGGLAGGGGQAAPDNAYQLRVAGYPEREMPLLESKRELMVDGIRPLDGHLVEAKHVRDPACTRRVRLQQLRPGRSATERCEGGIHTDPDGADRLRQWRGLWPPAPAVRRSRCERSRRPLRRRARVHAQRL